MIYGDESSMARMSEGDAKAMTKEYMDFTQGIVKSGHFRAGDALERSKTAVTVRVRDGKTLSTDGPFAETKEQLGGYYLVEARDIEDAKGLAAAIPGARSGSIEIRPVRPMPKAL